MEKTAREKLRIKKWEWIPVVGAIAFVYRIERWRLEIPDKAFRKTFGKYRSLWALVFFLLAIVFLTLFFTLRNKFSFGPYPWFFWLGLACGLLSNLVVIVPWSLYQLGLKKCVKNNEKTQNQTKLPETKRNS